MIGGSIRGIAINGRNFRATTDSDSNRKLGGYEAEVEMNGDGTARKIVTAVGWQISGLVVGINDLNEDQEFLQAVADAGPDGNAEFVTIAITYASGSVYQGTGTVAGDFQNSSQSTSATLDLQGPGKLVRQQ